MRLHAPQFAIGVVAAGVLTFGVVFVLLAFSPSAAAPDQPVVPTDVPSPTPMVVAADSLEPQIGAENLAIGVPIAGSEALLRSVQPGDRLDILASLSPQNGLPITTVLVRGATVMRPADQNEPLLVQVSAPDAVMLAHVVMRGTRIGYLLWPAMGSGAAAMPPPFDEQTARDVLGLSQPTRVVPTETAPPPPAAPTPLAATAQPWTGSGFLYQVQQNDSWSTIAATFGLPVDQLRQWNESPSDAEPVPGSLVFIPRPS